MYLIFALIDLLAFPPIACPEDANNIISVRKAHREDALPNPAKAIVPTFNRTVGAVFCDNATRICEGELRFCEGHPVLFPVLPILLWIPLEPSLSHAEA